MDMGDYGYKVVKRFISKDEILKRVTQEDIFQSVFGFKPVPYKYVKSPFRKDNHPECYFEWHKGILYFMDWTEKGKRTHRDCFNAIQDAFGISFYDSLVHINKHFKLNLLIEDKAVAEKLKTQPKKEIITPEIKKENYPLVFKARYFNPIIDRDFWQPYFISRENLIEDNVFPIIWYKIYSKKLRDYVIIRPKTRSYLIGLFENRAKIYTPDKHGKGKWATTCKQNDVWGLDSLPIRGKKLIITKSYKDKRVLTNFGTVTIGFQNEGMHPSNEILKDLCERFDDIIVFFDNDRAGIKAAETLVDKINDIIPAKARSVHLESSLLKRNISDPADLVKNKGKKPLNDFISENRLSN